jgi:hypothetical protein
VGQTLPEPAPVRQRDRDPAIYELEDFGAGTQPRKCASRKSGCASRSEQQK